MALKLYTMNFTSYVSGTYNNIVLNGLERL